MKNKYNLLLVFLIVLAFNTSIVMADPVIDSTTASPTETTAPSTTETTPADDSTDDAVDFGSSSGWGNESNWTHVQEGSDETVEIKDGSELTQDEKTAISSWKEDVESDTGSSAITLLRGAVAFLGIVIILYSVFLYLAYWFDRINNFIDISLLSILTLGRLVISPDDSVSTFSPSTEGLKTVTHKNIIFICGIGILLGVLILTGRIYFLIDEFIKIANKIGGTT